MAVSFPGSINALISTIYQDSDGTHSENVTVPSSAPYTYRLASASPYSYPSGYQVVPPSGISNVVTLSGGGNATWTEVPLGNALSKGQFSVDYTATPTGGQLTFSSADAGATPTATWTASTLVNEKLMQAVLDAAHSVIEGMGQASGLATLDANTNLSIPTGHKLAAPDSGTLSSTGGSGSSASPYLIAAGSNACGGVNVGASIPNGAIYQVNTTVVSAASRIFLALGGATSTLGWNVNELGISAGNYFQFIVDIYSGSGSTNLAGVVNWFVVN